MANARALQGRVQGQTQVILPRSQICRHTLIGKYSGFESGNRNRAGVGKCGNEAFDVVIGKPECLIAHKRPARGSTESVPDIEIFCYNLSCGIDFVIEKVSRAQRVIAPKPVSVAVEVV